MNLKRNLFGILVTGAALLSTDFALAQFPTGACCTSQGTCVIANQVGCAITGGRYKGNNVACSSVDCSGACCSLFGSCSDHQTADSCANLFGDFRGAETTCTSNTCTGACCVVGTCEQGLGRTTCGTVLGSFLGYGTNCAGVTCTGACCSRTGGCISTYALACDGYFFGRGTLCSEVSCSGACCLNNGSCSIYSSEVGCELLAPLGPGGIWKGVGSSCATASCAPAGACCVDNGYCERLTSDACQQRDGVYRGDNTRCEDTCLGACCLTDGQCVNATAISQCLVLGGRYAGNGLTCDEACTGACCITGDVCTGPISRYACDALAGGSYQGDGSRCENGTCPFLGCPGNGGCCVSNGSPGCESNSCCETVCRAQPSCCQSTWGPICAELASTLCGNHCTGSGLCCRPDASCVVTLASSCASQGGHWGGGGSSCLFADCTRGACCKDDGTCQDGISRLACRAVIGGEFRGHGTDCSTAFCRECPSAGNCCASHSSAGCVDQGCCLAVCEANPACCETSWGIGCATAAGTLCGGGSYCHDTGACCRTDGTCFNLQNRGQCDASGGRWLSGGICTVDACSFGACCKDDGVCQDDVTALSCQLVGGRHQGTGSSCSLVQCPACSGEGDCCAANGTPGCDNRACCRAVHDMEPFCGLVEWDELCVELATRICGNGDGTYCNQCPSSGDCCDSHSDPGCQTQTCCESVCATAPYCCTIEWDDLCALIARRTCSDLCPQTERADTDLDGDVDLIDHRNVQNLFTGPR